MVSLATLGATTMTITAKFATNLERAADHIDAVELPDGRWAHYADETSTWWVTDADTLAELCSYLDDEDEQVSRDAYSHWCAAGGAEEMPRGWTPDAARRAPVTIVTDGSRYEDDDDCLAAAAEEYASEHDLAGWDLAPRWEGDGDEHERILLTVPGWAAPASDDDTWEVQS